MQAWKKNFLSVQVSDDGSYVWTLSTQLPALIDYREIKVGQKTAASMHTAWLSISTTHH